MTMTLIETKTLLSAAASISFTSVPQAYTDLIMICSLRENGTDSARAFFMGINGTDLTTFRTLVGNGASASSNTTYVGVTNSGTGTSNTFSNVQFYIPNYTSNTLKTVSVDYVTENNATTAFAGVTAAVSSGTAAVTSVSVSGALASWIAGSMVSLYGITKGSDGITTVS
jgi:hypothetical protein